MKKRTFSLFMACLMVCSLFLTPAYAAHSISDLDADASVELVMLRATNYFSGRTGPLNSMAGKPFKLDHTSSGSVPAGAGVSKVEVVVTVSRGSMPFYLVVVEPNGM